MLIVYKTSAKKYRRVTSHETEEWCKIWKKKHFVWKVTRIRWILIGLFRAMYITFDLRNHRGIIFHNTEESCKIWRKTDLWFGKWHEDFGRFSPKYLKVSNWFFHGIPLSKIENAWTKNLQRICVEHWRMMKNWRGPDLSF